MPSRQPRWPIIGLNSCRSSTRMRMLGQRDLHLGGHQLLVGLVVRHELVQRRSSSRMVTGRPSISMNSPSKSARWIGSSLASVCGGRPRRRPGSSRASARCGRPRRTCARCGTGRCRWRLRVRCAPLPACRRWCAPEAAALSARAISRPKSPDSSGRGWRSGRRRPRRWSRSARSSRLGSQACRRPLIWRAFRSTCTGAGARPTQHLPMPRATTAACVGHAAARVVRMPLATLMPRRSSGEVSWRTRITALTRRLAHSSASSAKNTMRPVAAPAGRQAARDDLADFSRRRVEDRVQQVVQAVGSTRCSAVFVDHALRQHLHRDAHHGRAGALAVARLQHPQALPGS